MLTLNHRTLSGRTLGPLAFALALLVTLLISIPAGAQVPDSAQTTASPGRVEEQFQEDLEVPDVQPQVDVADPILQQVPEGADKITFQLNSVTLEGASAYTEAQLRPVYADKLGTTVTLADVYAISSALTAKYRNEGYILTQVVVPPQTIESGDVRMQVVEGYIDQVSVEGNTNGLDLVRQYAGHIRTGRAMNVRDLERYLLLINDLPGLEARSVLSPSPTQTGAADLRIIVERDPFDALLAADNYGSRYLGPLQLTAAGSTHSLFGLNERITLQTVQAPDPGDRLEMSYFAASYEQPVWNNGTVIQFAGNHTNTDPGYDLEVFEVKGRSEYMSVKVSHPFIRSRSVNFTAYGLFDWRKVVSKNILDRREDRIRALRAGGRYEFLDTLLGVGVNSINIEIAKGLSIFNASDEGDSGLSRSAGDPQFFKANIDIQRLQRITSEVNLLVAASGQVSNGPLLSSEEFGIGGPNIGRGFDASEIIGDEGISGKIELQWNEPYEVMHIHDYQLFTFFDAGSVWNDDATTLKQKRDTITSAGFGLRTDFTPTTQGGFAVTFPLNRDVQTMGDTDPRFYANISQKF